MICYTVWYFSVVYYIILHHTILYYTILCYTVPYCTLLYCIVPYYIVQYYTLLYYTILYCTVLYCIILYCIMLLHTVLYYTIRSIILYNTQVGPGRRPPGPAQRPHGPEVQRGLGGGHAPQPGVWGQRLPGNILVFKIFRMLFGKQGCYSGWCNSVVQAHMARGVFGEVRQQTKRNSKLYGIPKRAPICDENFRQSLVSNWVAA